MLKRIALILSIAVFSCTIGLSQEKPAKEQEESQETLEVVNDQTTEVIEKLPSEVAWNKVCPVKGNPIEDNTPTVEFDGKTYGFCCPGCDTKFAKNPKKYSKNLSEDGSKFLGR
jgi:YHS domain-containing protein